MEWIRTKDRLPETPNWVIAYVNGDIFPAIYFAKLKKWENDVLKEMEGDLPTYWMPLPEPPIKDNVIEKMLNFLDDNPDITVEDITLALKKISDKM